MDVVVTLTKSFGLRRWIAEGDPAGTDWSGQEWGWYMGGHPPKNLEPGDRVYVVYDGHLIGYSPLVCIRQNPHIRGYVLVRGGGAVAVTIDERIRGFQGCRYRWWKREDERPFPDWQELVHPYPSVADAERCLRIRKESKRGAEYRSEDMAFCERMLKKYPDWYKATQQEVFDDTVPFGSDAKWRRVT
jgi:hypothetical protein